MDAERPVGRPRSLRLAPWTRNGLSAVRVHSISIQHAVLREQARKSSVSAALNTSEGAARTSRADKSRVYGIAHAEVCEAVSAVQIAGRIRACAATDVASVTNVGLRAKNLLSRLIK